MIYAEMAADAHPEAASELRSVVGDDVIWHAMLADDVLEEEPSQLGRVDVLSAGLVDGALHEPFDDDDNPCVVGSR